MSKKLTDEERQALGGSTYDQMYFTDDELQNAAKAVAAAKESGDWTSAHDYVQQIRKNYGYSGGDDGSEFQSLGSSSNDSSSDTEDDNSFASKLSALANAINTSAEAPTYVSNYADAINALNEKIQNREAFSYDYNTDPSYQAYKKQYTREGQRATADALGQAAALTGGQASTAAVNAATQAGDYYSAQLADKIPELYQAAYSMYQDEGNTMNNNLATLLSLENADYSKYQDQLAQYNTDRNYNYSLLADALAQENYDEETEYSQNQDAKEEALNRISALLETGDASGISAGDLALSGYTQDQLNAIAKYYATQNSNSSGSGGTVTDESYKSLVKSVPSYVLEHLEAIQGNESEVYSYLTQIKDTVLGGSDALFDGLFDTYSPTQNTKLNTTLLSESEFNKSTAMQRKYGTYQNYVDYVTGNI